MSFVATAIAGSAILGVTGAAISANAAGNASSQEQQGEANALNFQKQVYGQTQADEAPYLALGTTGTTDLQSQLPSLTAGFDPTAAGVPAQFSFDGSQLADTPGYQFALQQGEQGIDRAAAASGGINGGTQKALAQYDVGLADQNYNNAYSQQLGAYNTNYGNAYNTFESNQSNTFNRLYSLINSGQSAAGTIAQAGTGFANAAGNAAVGSANAQAAGTVGTANALSSGLSGVGSSATNALLLQQLLNGGTTNSTGVNTATNTTASQLGLATPVNNPYLTPSTYSSSGYGATP